MVKEHPVQNLTQDSKPSVSPRLTSEEEMQTVNTRRVNSVPPAQSITTAIIHREQSPWLNIRDSTSSDVLDAKNVLQRAKSVNINGKEREHQHLLRAKSVNINTGKEQRA